VHQKAPLPDQTIELNSSELGCLNGSAKVIDSYLHGQIDSDSKIAAVWDCAADSLRLFGQKTQGANPDYYTPRELTSFLQKYFLNEYQFTDGLIVQVMELKRAFVGGQSDRITRDELAHVQDLLNILKTQTIALRPYMPITPAHLATANPDDLEAAISVMRNAADAVGVIFQKNNYPYLFTNLAAFVQEFNAAGGFHYFEGVSSRLPLITALKSILVAPEGDRIAGNEWQSTLDAVAGWYGVVLRVSHLLQYDSGVSAWSKGDGMDRLMKTVIEALGYLNDACLRHPNSHNQITFAEFDSFIDALTSDELQFGRGQVTPDTLKAVVRTVVQKVLGFGEAGINGNQSLGLNQSVLKRIASEMNGWNQGQKFLELSFRRAAGQGGEGDIDDEGFIASDLLSASLPILTGKPLAEIDPVFVSEATSLADTIRNYPPFFAGNDTMMSFPGGGTRRYSFHGLSEYHWMSELGNLLEISYAADPVRVQKRKGVTRNEFKAFFADVLPIGAELRIFNPYDPTVPDNRFRDANLFLFASDGGTLMTPEESTQLLAFLMSGKQLSNRIHAEIAGVCPNGPTDFFLYPTIEPNCYRKVLDERFSHFMDHLPLLAVFYNNLSAAERIQFEHDLEDAARTSHYSNKVWIGSSDSDAMSALLQYLEAIFSRFDTNLSGTIDKNEAHLAFQVFKPTLESLTSITDEKELEAVFTYMLNFGEAPSASGLQAVKFYMWEHVDAWNFQADRAVLLHILAQMTTKTP
jgi:hypothetical protein